MLRGMFQFLSHRSRCRQRPIASGELAARLPASSTRCAWSSRRRRARRCDAGRVRSDRSSPATARDAASTAARERVIGAAAAGLEACSATRSAGPRAAIRVARSTWSPKRSADGLASLVRPDPRARPGPAPSASPDRRPIRSSFRRRAALSRLPSRCAAKISELAVTPEPQLATNGLSGSAPASTNSCAISSRRLNVPSAIVERGERQVARAGDMAGGDARARVGLAAFEAGACRGHRAAERRGRRGPRRLLTTSPARSTASKRAVRAAGLAAFGRPAFRQPFLEAAVEDRDLARRRNGGA